MFAAHEGRDRPRPGNRGFSGSPGAATFRCADGWIATAANTPAQFATLCRLLGVEDVLADLALLDVDALAEFMGEWAEGALATAPVARVDDPGGTVLDVGTGAKWDRTAPPPPGRAPRLGDDDGLVGGG